MRLVASALITRLQRHGERIEKRVRLIGIDIERKSERDGEKETEATAKQSNIQDMLAEYPSRDPIRLFIFFFLILSHKLPLILIASIFHLSHSRVHNVST